MAKNRRTWAGGRAYDTADGRTRWTIRKLVNGRSYFVTLGVDTEKQAMAELALFLRDPKGYVAQVEARKREPLPSPGDDDAVALDDVRVAAFLAELEAKGRTRLYIADARRYLASWDEILRGRDLRKLDSKTTKKLRDSRATGRKYRTIIFKSFCSFLVDRGDLDPVENPGRFLKVEAARRRHDVKGYTIAEVESLYSALSSQRVRDVFCVQAKTGLHWTEVDRIARGEGVLRPVQDDAEIAGTVTFKHKTGRLKKVSLDAQAFEAAKRLQAHGRAVSIHAIDSGVATACKRDETLKPVSFGALRHSYATWLQEAGTVYTPSGKGVPIEVVAEALGHTSVRTTKLHYLEGQTPPLYRVPISLIHPEDPPILGRATQAGCPPASKDKPGATSGARLRVIK